jgi:methylenetetrahydrofolate--tRNA-(uracil-5-)-methyltransferase
MDEEKHSMTEITVIGGGLAGSEAAWQAAQRGWQVNLFEMRPVQETGAHVSGDLAELVCSNSLGSNLIDRSSGLLKEELRQLGSMLLECAETTALPAGGALAVDREAFSALVTQRISAHPNIDLIRAEVQDIPPGPVVVASGPLTSPRLTQALRALTGTDSLFFFDAIAPILTRDSIDMNVAFRASRYSRGEQEDGDYINCPFDKDQYYAFVEALNGAARIELKAFEAEIETGVRAGASQFFEGCLPVEVLAGRDPKALAYGPLRPVGLYDPHTGRRPYAVLQLRQDNLAGDLYNMVGFQTNLTFSEQRRVFRMIPGLENADFVRFGQMHRNTFIASPLLLEPSLQFRGRPELFFAGQITGVEGYMGNISTGLLAGVNVARLLQGDPPFVLPVETMLGSLCHYVTHADLKDFQPMKANFGILPPLPEGIKGKRARAALHVERSLAALKETLHEQVFTPAVTSTATPGYKLEEG